MDCPACGTANAPSRRFCLECGTALAAPCPACGTSNEPGAKFCGACGTRLGGASAPQAGAGDRPTATTAAAPAAASPATLAERRVVSVLFADLVGFTTLAAERDPEAVRELLTRYFALSRETIERYGGRVEKFIGDAVMAVWGAPVAHEDDAERAVRAGLDLVGAVPSLSDADQGLDLRVRAGILTGEAAVTLGATGEGMVAGDLVNTASRLQSVAPPGVVLVGEATRRAAPAIAYEAVGEQLLRGRPAPVAAYRALRVVGDRAGRQAEVLEPPFVGRDDQLRLLRELFHTTARDRRARLVSIVGQAGIGKSRLAWELEKYLDGVAERIYWHAGRSPSYGAGITFWALGEMVRRRAGLAEGADERTTRNLLAASLQEWVADAEERRWIEPRLLSLLGVGEAPSGGREELFAAWRTFFERVAERGPTVMVFEDLQWADTGLLDFIDHVLEWSRALPIFILTLARPELLERRPDWGTSQPNAVAMRLEPLPDPAMHQLLDALIPGLPARAASTILARASGIPLYAVETVRMLLADGRLVEEDGHYRPTVDLSALEVPDTLVALVGARLDALDPPDRSLVQGGSVLGQRFTLAALAAVAGEPPAAIEPRLRALVRREILTLESDPRSPERGQYGFVQGILREVAYGTLARLDRRARHLAAARHFEELGDEALAGALAEQYLSAYRALPEGPEAETLRAQARVSLRAAADRAIGLGSFAQAVQYLDEALEVTPGVADQAMLLQRLGDAAAFGGLFGQAEPAYQKALELAASTDDRRLFVRALAGLGSVLIFDSRIGAAVEILEAHRDEALALGDDPATGRFAEALARAYFRSSRHEDAVTWAERAVAILEPEGDEEAIAQALVTKASSLIGLGRRREGLALLDGATRSAEARGLSSVAVRGGINLGAFMIGEDPAGALERVKASIALTTRLGMEGFHAYLLGNAAGAAARVGEWDWFLGFVDDALTFLRDEGAREWAEVCRAALLTWRGGGDASRFEASLQADTERGDPQGIANSSGDVGRMAFLAGDYGSAFRAFERSVALGFREYAPFAARCAVLGGDREAAERMLAVAEARGRSGSYEADNAMVRADLAALEGRRADALAEYAVALGRYRELRIRFDQALVGLDMVALLGPHDPEVLAAADASREILSELRATPLLERLDALLAEEGRPAPGRGAAAESSLRPGGGTQVPTSFSAAASGEGSAKPR